MIPPIDIFCDKPVVERRIKNAASWFYWIAGITLIYGIVDILGGDREPIFGLAVPIAFAEGHDTADHIVAAICGVISLPTYCVIAFLAGKGARWAFIVGLAFYAIDTLVFVVTSHWISAACHVYALFRIFQGIPAAGRLAQINAAEKAQAQGQIGAWYGGAQPYVQPSAPQGAWPPPPQPGWQSQPPPSPSGWQPQLPPAEQPAQASASQPAYSPLSAPEAPAYHMPVPGDLTAEEAPAPSEP